jgi:antitoxin component of MazEF toxin-antitoxin module
MVLAAVILQLEHTGPCPGRLTVVKKLSAIGNSLGIIIEKPILDLLDIDRTTDLEVKTDGDALIIRPVRMSQKERVARSAKRMMDTHAETLKKLAE